MPEKEMSVIETICQQMIKSAGDVIALEQVISRLEDHNNDKVLELFEHLQISNLEALQTLTVALTGEMLDSRKIENDDSEDGGVFAPGELDWKKKTEVIGHGETEEEEADG